MTKKSLSLLMALILLFCTIVPVYAIDANDHEPLNPEYVVTCPSGAKHHMVPRGTGKVYSGTPGSPGVALLNGHTFYWTQCTQCYEAIISQYRPHLTNTLGYYKVLGVSDTLSGIGTDAYLNGKTLDYFSGNVLTDSYWQGYSFYRY